MKTIISLACVLIANLGIAIPNYAHGQDKVEVKTVVERLNNPCGVAIQSCDYFVTQGATD